MPEYRFFIVAKNGHIYEPSIAVDAASDAGALKRARERLRAAVEVCDIEVWQGMRLVAYLTPEQFPVVVTEVRPEADPSPQA